VEVLATAPHLRPTVAFVDCGALIYGMFFDLSGDVLVSTSVVEIASTSRGCHVGLV